MKILTDAQVEGNLNIPQQTASRILSTDAVQNVTALDTVTYPDLTELSYVKGVTSAIQTQIDALSGSLVFKGSWDPTTGVFPGGGAAQQGWFYIVSAAGTVGGINFTSGDQLYAIVDNASTTIYAGNWTHIDVTANPVLGPASSTDNNIPVFDGTTGKLLKESNVRISGGNNFFGIGSMDAGSSTFQFDPSIKRLRLQSGDSAQAELLKLFTSDSAATTSMLVSTDANDWTIAANGSSSTNNGAPTNTFYLTGPGGIFLSKSQISGDLKLGTGLTMIPSGAVQLATSLTVGTSIVLTTSTGDRLLATGGSHEIRELDTATYPSLTEISYVKGVTSSIQAQINAIPGTVTQVTSANADIGVANTTTTPLLTLNSSTTGTANSIVKRDANGLIVTPNFVEGFTTTATAGGTTTLTVSSTYTQIFTGTLAQTVVLPTTGVVAGQQFYIQSRSTGLVTVNASGGTTAIIMAPNSSCLFTAITATPTTAGNWNVDYKAINFASGKVATFNNSLNFSGTDNTTMTFPAATTTVAGLGTTQTFTGANTFNNANVLAGTATMAVFNTVATTLSFAGAATTLNIGGTPTTAITHNYSTNATATGVTKTINFGTGGAAGSTTTINIGSANTAAGISYLSGSTTGTVTSITTNALTTGTAFDVTTTSASLAATNGFIRYLNNSAPSNQTALFYRVQPNNTVGSGISVLNSGFVGIGINPTTTLQISGAPNSQSSIKVAHTTANWYTMMDYIGTGRTWRTGVGNASETLNNLANKFFVFDGTANAARLVIDTAGNVGLGDNAPAEKLSLSGTSTSIKIAETGTNTTGWLTKFTDRLAMASTNNLLLLGGATTNANGQGILIDSAGDVGIGVASPTAVLHLKAGTATANTAPIKMDSGVALTTPEAGTVEYDGTSFFATSTAGVGRGTIDVYQRFRLTADGSQLSTNSNFFGTTSGVNLEANCEYEIDITAYYSKTTAGTVTWTMANSVVPARMAVEYKSTPTTGMPAVPGASDFLDYIIPNITLASYTLTTGTLSTGVNHYAYFKIRMKTGGSNSTFNIQIAPSVGTVMPVINSEYTVRKLTANNVGIFI